MAEFPLEIDVQQVAEQLQRHDPPLLIDCREPAEWAVAVLPGAVRLPMSELPEAASQWTAHLDRDRPAVVYCHHGVRSAHVATWLRQQGYRGVQSMAGGIDRWSVEIDPQVPRY